MEGAMIGMFFLERIVKTQCKKYFKQNQSISNTLEFHLIFFTSFMLKNGKHMQPIIIGTAGHIDHGKTSLVRAITGIDTDTLKEERERGITIDIGFAHWENGITFIDVPGHEKFIRNMVAGVNAVDFALLTVAADDGIMPQTLEHLNILQWLGIRHGAVVITKTDLVSGAKIRMLLKELEERTRPTFLHSSPVFEVSAKTGEKLDLLKNYLRSLPEKLPPRRNHQCFRVYADRVFTKPGFGNVVTGTVLSGEAKTGDSLAVYPDILSCRIRGIQNRHAATGAVMTGERAALNLSGIDGTKLQRGAVLAAPDCFEARASFFAKVHFGKTIKPLAALRLLTGTAELFARVSPVPMLAWPEKEGYIRVRINQPLPIASGDRFILREKNSAGSVGGGVIAWPDPLTAHGLTAHDKTSLFDSASAMDYHEVIRWFFRVTGYIDLLSVSRTLGIDPHNFEIMVRQPQIGETVISADRFIFQDTALKKLRETFLGHLKRHHEECPDIAGIRIRDFYLKFFHQYDPDVLNIVLDSLITSGAVVRNLQDIRLRDHQVRVNPKEALMLEQVERMLLKDLLQPPGITEIAGHLNISEKDCLHWLHRLITLKRAVKADSRIYFHRKGEERAYQLIIDFLQKNKDISFQDFKQLTGVSRKYALALLEYFDRTGVTHRTGDVRILNPDTPGHSIT